MNYEQKVLLTLLLFLTVSTFHHFLSSIHCSSYTIHRQLNFRVNNMSRFHFDHDTSLFTCVSLCPRPLPLAKLFDSSSFQLFFFVFIITRVILRRATNKFFPALLCFTIFHYNTTLSDARIGVFFDGSSFCQFCEFRVFHKYFLISKSW